jgi:hypothetical protein
MFGQIGSGLEVIQSDNVIVLAEGHPGRNDATANEKSTQGI